MRNPYEAPSEAESTVSSEDSESPPSGCVAPMLASLGVASVCLVQFMILDFFVVRLRPYPEEANDYDWALVFFPVMPVLLLVVAKRFNVLRLNAGMFLASILLGFVLAVPLVVTAGIWFHFAIGGRL